MRLGTAPRLRAGAFTIGFKTFPERTLSEELQIDLSIAQTALNIAQIPLNIAQMALNIAQMTLSIAQMTLSITQMTRSIVGITLSVVQMKPRSDLIELSRNQTPPRTVQTVPCIAPEANAHARSACLLT